MSSDRYRSYSGDTKLKSVGAVASKNDAIELKGRRISDRGVLEPYRAVLSPKVPPLAIGLRLPAISMSYSAIRLRPITLPMQRDTLRLRPNAIKLSVISFVLLLIAQPRS